MSFERGARTERNQREMVPRADLGDGDDVVGRGGEADEVARRRRVLGIAAAVMLSDGRGIGHAGPKSMSQRFQCGREAVRMV